MGEASYTVRAEVWLHPGEAGWHFVTLPPELTGDLRARLTGGRRAFGSVPVHATLGTTSWATSLFADK